VTSPRTALVTGATDGIGISIARALTSKGMRVFVTGRRSVDLPGLEFLQVDHSTVAANIALARKVTRLDVLVNNLGGALSAHRSETADSIENTIALNFVGPFVLTTEVLPLLRHSGSGRIVNIVSSALRMWRGDPFLDVLATEQFVPLQVLAHAKLLNTLWTLALARRLEGSGVVANAVNPGMAWTPGTRALTPELVPAWRWIWPIVRWFQKRASAEKAAQAPVFLATAPEAAAMNGRVLESNLKSMAVPPVVADPAAQDRTWELAEALSRGHR
jgi:NAD(P)-dependent dehydrogenase (short-subunit alcohol dehydrogenase family)